MKSAKYRLEIARIGRIAGPLVVSQISQVGMGFTDTLMAGRLGAADLAAVAIGSSLWLPIYLACVGIMTALSPMVAQLHGAGRTHGIAPLFRQSLWLGAGLALLATPLTAKIGSIMPWLRIEPAIIPTSNDYLAAIAWGMPAVCIYLAMRFVCEGSGHTKPIMYIQLVALAVNALGNYILMFGKWGAPALGAVGAGWSSAIVLCLDALLIFLYLRTSNRFRRLALFHPFDAPRLSELRRLARLGIPIGMATVTEITLFAAVALLMGSLGTIPVAAHQVAINYAALAFMVPLGISMGTTVRVGNGAGSGNIKAARDSGFVGMAMCVCVMALSAMIMLLFPEQIVGLYTKDVEVSQLAVKLLFMAAIFQTFDGLQVGALGALRGMRDTTVPLLITLLSYWLVGFPLAYQLGIAHAFGPRGLWIGLIFGLTLAAVLLCIRFHLLTKHRARGGPMASPARP
jgi:MATE family multidrug resistance protein